MSLQNNTQVWQERDRWQGLYKVLAINNYNIILDLLNGPIKFQSTVIKPYFQNKGGNNNKPKAKAAGINNRSETRV